MVSLGGKKGGGEAEGKGGKMGGREAGNSSKKRIENLP